MYPILFHYLERFLTEYEARFDREYGYFRLVPREVIECYLCQPNFMIAS